MMQLTTASLSSSDCSICNQQSKQIRVMATINHLLCQSGEEVEHFCDDCARAMHCCLTRRGGHAKIACIEESQDHVHAVALLEAWYRSPAVAVLKENRGHLLLAQSHKQADPALDPLLPAVAKPAHVAKKQLLSESQLPQRAPGTCTHHGRGVATLMTQMCARVCVQNQTENACHAPHCKIDVHKPAVASICELAIGAALSSFSMCAGV
jgi:hypothetical protein